MPRSLSPRLRALWSIAVMGQRGRAASMAAWVAVGHRRLKAEISDRVQSLRVGPTPSASARCVIASWVLPGNLAIMRAKFAPSDQEGMRFGVAEDHGPDCPFGDVAGLGSVEEPKLEARADRCPERPRLDAAGRRMVYRLHRYARLGDEEAQMRGHDGGDLRDQVLGRAGEKRIGKPSAATRDPPGSP